jgi:hypothetical protein
MLKSCARLVVAAFGVFSVAWALQVISIYRVSQPIDDKANAMLSGEIFNSSKVRFFRDSLSATPDDLLDPSGRTSLAVIRLLLLESRLKSERHNVSLSDYDQVQANIDAALARTPSNALMWFAAFWLENVRIGPGVRLQNLLRMSYLSGPNEGWIAIGRNSQSLSVFDRLPRDLSEEVLEEFVGLVRSGLYDEAEKILEGPGSAVRDQLLGRLIKLDDGTRRLFAKDLAAKGLDGLTVPGLDKRHDHQY